MTTNENLSQNALKNSFLSKVLRTQEIGVVMILLVMAIFLTITSDNFLTSNNLFNVIRQFSWIAIAGFGAIMVIITGGIDLSVGSIMALTGLMAALALKAGWGLWPSIIAGLLAGVGVGLLNGLLVSKAKLPPFIATLGMMSVARGLCYGLTNGLNISDLPDEFVFFGRYDLPLFGINIPLPVIIMVILAIIVNIFLSRTIWGYWIYGLGGNEQATLLSGVNTGWVKLIVYTLTGLLTGIGGLLMTARLGVATPTAAMGYELDIIAAVFIGGASTSGGEGTILGVLIGAAIMQVLRNGLVLLGFPAYWQSAAIGLVIIVALSIDQYRKQRQK